MVTTKLNLSMTEPSVRQIYAKQGDTGRVLDITLDQTPEDGTLRILRPDGVEVTSEAVTGGEVESGSSFESLTEADVTELSVGIEPVQDLNGYDKPWVGGAGKNKLNNTATTTTYRGVTFTVNSDGTVTANGTASGEASFTIRVDTSSVYGDFYFNALYGYTSDTSYNAYMWDNTTGARCKQWDGTTNSVNSYNGALRQVKIVQGNTVYMSCRVLNGVTANNVVFYPMIVASTETDPTWQPYSNICPVTGHDGVTVTRTGKNLARIRDVDATFSGITWQSDGASIRVKGTATSNSSPFVGAQVTNFDTMLNGVYPAGTYTVSCRGWGMSQAADRMTVHAKYADGTGISEVDGTRITPSTVGGQPNDRTFTATKPFKLDFWCYIQSGSTADFTATIQLELGSTATAYEPYQGSTYTTSLGQTVYGGTLDMVTGVLTVDKAMVTLDGRETWNVNSATSGLYYTTIANLKANGSAVSNTFEQTNVAGANMVNGQLKLVAPNLANFKTEHATVTDWKTWLSSNNVQLCYELATPQTYQLTAQQIKTLVGTNNVWASSGDIVNIKFTYGGLLSGLPSDATSVVGKCYCDVEQNGVSSMPFTLNVKKNERAT